MRGRFRLPRYLGSYGVQRLRRRAVAGVGGLVLLLAGFRYAEGQRALGVHLREVGGRRAAAELAVVNFLEGIDRGPHRFFVHH